MSVNAPNMENFSIDHRDWDASTWANNYSLGLPVAKEMYFEEAAQSGGGTYAAEVNLPQRAMLIDIIVYNEALWTDGTAAALNVGDETTAGVAVDADGYFAAVSVKATDLLAEQTVRLSGNLATAGGKIGAYGNVGTNTHLTDLYYPSGGKITATIAVTDGDGTAGKTHVVVIYAVANRTTATFTAS